MDRTDIRVVQSGSGTRLSAEPFEGLWVVRDIFGQEFQRDKTPKLGVLGFVNDTHPATAQLLDYAVVRNSQADHNVLIVAIPFGVAGLSSVVENAARTRMGQQLEKPCRANVVRRPFQANGAIRLDSRDPPASSPSHKNRYTHEWTNVLSLAQPSMPQLACPTRRKSKRP